MLTLNDLLKKQFKGKTIPIDFKKMALEQHYSQSKDQIFFKGDMDIFHLLRSLKKELNVYLKKQIEEEERQANKIKKSEKWLETCPIDWQTSRHPSSEIRTINFEL